MLSIALGSALVPHGPLTCKCHRLSPTASALETITKILQQGAKVGHPRHRRHDMKSQCRRLDLGLHGSLVSTKHCCVTAESSDSWAVSAVSEIRMLASKLRFMNCKEKSLKEGLWNFHQAPLRRIGFGRLRQGDAALLAIPVGPGWHNKEN